MSPAPHAGLTSVRWQQLALVEQLANIGSEVGRATRAKSLGNEVRFGGALDRCLELFDLTLADDRWRHRRREIARAREIVCDFLVGDNVHGSTAESLDAYFLPFAMAARRLGRREGPTTIATDGPEAPTTGRSVAPSVDRSEIRRAIAMNDAEREAYYLGSNQNMLVMFEDARRSR